MPKYVWLTYLTFPVVVLLILAVEAGPALSADSDQVLRGEIVMLLSDVCVIKDDTGATTLLRVDPRTKMIGTVKEGAKVEVQVSPDRLAMMIKVTDEPAPAAP